MNEVLDEIFEKFRNVHLKFIVVKFEDLRFQKVKGCRLQDILTKIEKLICSW